MKPSMSVSSHSITSINAGVINAHVFEAGDGDSSSIRGTIVTVHPWSTLGGGEHNTIGLARHITSSANKSEQTGSSWRVVTFTMKSNPIWKGGAVWGICSNHSYEIQQTVDVVNWVREKYGIDHNIVLLGSSAGAPMAGTAMAQLTTKQQQHLTEQQHYGNIVSAYIAVGYTFGNFAALGFGRHFSSVVTTPLPRLFIMGEHDEFTTVDQLEQMAERMKTNGVVDVKIVEGVGHFKLESPSYDPMVAKMVLDWLDKVPITD